jgi:UAF complex subunit Rrn10
MQASITRKRRCATLYDAVAGKVGVNGFLTREQRDSARYIPQAPEEVLLRSINAPDIIPYDFYAAADLLQPGDLPESGLLKAVHIYASDFYSLATHDHGKHDFKSLDETALIAMGFLLEEAAREMLGETGDMALVEAEGMEDGLPETKLTNYQVKGKVKPPPTPQYGSEESGEDEEESPKKKRKE